jgi:acetyltransferase
MLVNPHHRMIDGLAVDPNVASLPQAPDLAVIVTPAAAVPSLIGELAEHGTCAVVIITAGFGELGQRGQTLQQAALDGAKPHLLRIVGPNCVGIMVPWLGLDATFSHLAAPAGDIAFLSQSGAMITAMLDWAAPRDIGFSHVVSLGDMADVDFGDMLDYLAADPHTRAILLYVEGNTHGRKFMSAARAASRIKPVLVLKAGPLERRCARCHLAYRRPCWSRCRLRRRVPPGRDAAGWNDGRAIRRSGDPGVDPQAGR